MPGKALTSGCGLRCTFGISPTVFNTPPLPGKPAVNGLPMGLVTDTTPLNIPGFIMCNAPTNPTVIAATVSALGIPTPGACTPILAPWVPGSPTVLATGVPIATVASQSLCAYLGVVGVDLSTNLFVDV
jgi:hypothetical protein